MTAPAGANRYYFYLSYAHSAPIGPEALPDTDYWVGVLFRDLSQQVATLTGADATSAVGYYDDLARPGVNWKATLADVLGATEVFVALYSPGYFNKSWPRRERASFVQQFAAAADADQRVLPVLWVPMPAWDHPGERAAAQGLGAGVPAYAANGLRALCRLAMYRSQYAQVLASLAHRIVQIARSGTARSAAPVTIDDIELDAGEPTDMAFGVTVLAPAGGDLPAGRAPAAYGAAARAWEPYQFPIAEYAVNVAERLGLSTRILDWDGDRGELHDGPAVALIDPWITETPAGVAAVAALGALPDWVTPVLVGDRRDGQWTERGADLAATLADKLKAAGVRHLRRIVDVDQLAKVMPSLINDTCRRYLKNAPVFLPKGVHSGLRRIGGDDGAQAGTPGEGADD